MKILKVENPLTEEQAKDIEKYFKEEIYCDCGTTFETDIRDYEFERRALDKGSICKYYIKVTCPICKREYERKFVFSDEDIKTFEIYKTYLDAKEKLQCKEQ